MQFPRSSGFDSPPFAGQTLAETRCLQEPAPCSGYPRRHPVPLPLSTVFRHGGLAATRRLAPADYEAAREQ